MQLKIFDDLPHDIILFLKDNNHNYSIEPFMDPKWLNIWWKNIGFREYESIRFFVFYKNNLPSLIIPLVKKIFLRINFVEIAGGKVSDYLNPIYNIQDNFSSDELSFIKTEIKKYFNKSDFLFFKKQIINSKKDNPILKLGKAYVNYYKRYSIDLNLIDKNRKLKKILNDNKRQIKRLKKKFNDFNFLVCDNNEQKKKFIEVMIMQKEKKYIHSKVWNMFEYKFYKDFYREVGLSNLYFANIHISSIKILDKHLSVHFGLYTNKKFYYLMPSYDYSNFAIYSPGNILLENLINFSKNVVSDFFDFTIGDEKYKKRWSNREDNIYNVIVPITLKGLLIKYIILLFFFLKKNKFISKFYSLILSIIRK